MAEIFWKVGEELDRWLSTKKSSTRGIYLGSWKLYKTFIESELGKKFEDAELAKYLIDEIEEEERKPRRERGEVSRRLIRWGQWMRKRGLSRNTVKTHVGAIMGFYRENGFRIRFTRRFSDLFPAGSLPENKKKLLQPEDVKKLIDHAKCLRDKAMILVQYEGGMDTKTLCEMNVGHVMDILLKETVQFLTIHLYRAKEEWEYFTHIGPNAIKALRAYLKERKSKGYTLSNNSPLFVKSWTKKGKPRRVTTRVIEEVVRDTAIRAGLVNPAILKPRQHSPVKPYSLRSSFATLLENDNCPFQFKEFWQGHKIKYRGAYFVPTEELSLQTYMAHYRALSIEKATSTVNELERQVREQQVIITSLSRRLRRLEDFMAKYVKQAEEEMEITKYISENPVSPRIVKRGEELFQAK